MHSKWPANIQTAPFVRRLSSHAVFSLETVVAEQIQARVYIETVFFVRDTPVFHSFKISGTNFPEEEESL